MLRVLRVLSLGSIRFFLFDRLLIFTVLLRLVSFRNEESITIILRSLRELVTFSEPHLLVVRWGEDFLLLGVVGQLFGKDF